MTAIQNEYADMNAGGFAKQQGYKRNLQNTRVQQKKTQYDQRLAGDVKNSHYDVQRADAQNTVAQKTDAQKKQALSKKQKKQAKALSQKKASAKMKTYQQDIKRYKRTPWTLMYIAVGANLLGGFAVIFFGLGYLLVIPATVFIDIMVWQAVGGKERVAIRTAVIAVTGIKILISPLPSGLILVFFTQSVAKKKEQVAKRQIKKIQKQISKQ